MARSAIIGFHVVACLTLARCAAGVSPEPQAPPAPAAPAAPAVPAATKAAERPAPGTVRVLSIEQEAMGLPDQRSEVPVRQKILLDGDHNRVILTVFGEAPPSGEPGENGAAGKVAGKKEFGPQVVD